MWMVGMVKSTGTGFERKEKEKRETSRLFGEDD
jgi:hypothetical protein